MTGFSLWLSMPWLEDGSCRHSFLMAAGDTMGWCSIGLSSRGDLAGASSALASETVGGSKFYMLLLCVIFIIIFF